MMLSDYYQTLGIPPGAGKDVIRKAYRKKVLQLHPDRNPSTAAHAEFLRVREAYDALMGTHVQPLRKHTAPDTKPYPKYSKQANDPLYKARWQQYRKQRQAKQAEEAIKNSSLYPILVYMARAVAIAGAALSLLLLADFVMPAQVSTHTILNRNMEIMHQRGISVENRKLITEAYMIPVKRELFFLISEGDKIEVATTQIMGIPKSLRYADATFRPAYSIFTSFSMFAVALLALSVTGLYSWARKSDLLVNSFFNLALLVIVVYIISASS